MQNAEILTYLCNDAVIHSNQLFRASSELVLRIHGFPNGRRQTIGLKNDTSYLFANYNCFELSLMFDFIIRNGMINLALLFYKALVLKLAQYVMS